VEVQVMTKRRSIVEAVADLRESAGDTAELAQN
jgi:hypothetical protein